MTILTKISGFMFHPTFLSKAHTVNLQQKAVDLHKTIQSSAKSGIELKGRTYLSQQHNLNSEERYRQVHLIEEGKRKSAQHFEKYGEEGHQLTYFIGNQNIPSFIRAGLIEQVVNHPSVKALGTPLNWNFTFNTYSSLHEDRIAGFPFHKDVESNGDISLIYSLGADAHFQIRHPKQKEAVKTFLLSSNSLVVLSGEARWNFEHRVMPMKVEEGLPSLDQNIKRISLVLGAKRS